MFFEVIVSFLYECGGEYSSGFHGTYIRPEEKGGGEEKSSKGVRILRRSRGARRREGDRDGTGGCFFSDRKRDIPRERASSSIVREGKRLIADVGDTFSLRPSFVGVGIA